MCLSVDMLNEFRYDNSGTTKLRNVEEKPRPDGKEKPRPDGDDKKDTTSTKGTKKDIIMYDPNVN